MIKAHNRAMSLSGIARMNIAALDDKTFRELHAYFAASAECAANAETKAEALAYLAAFNDEARCRQKQRA